MDSGAPIPSVALTEDAPAHADHAPTDPVDDSGLWTEVHYVNKAKGHFVHDDKRPRQVLSFFAPHLYAFASGHIKYPDGHEEDVVPWTVARDPHRWQCLGVVGVKPESFGNKQSCYDTDQESVVIYIFTASLMGLVGELTTDDVAIVWDRHNGLISGVLVRHRKDQGALVSSINTASKRLRRATIHRYIANKSELNAQGEVLAWFMQKVGKERRRAAGGVRPDEIPTPTSDPETPPCPSEPAVADADPQ
jgi:hypothetical protein